MTGMRSFSVVVCLSIGLVGCVQAWGDEGHKIICAIADQLLDTKDQAQARRLVNLYRPPYAKPYKYLSVSCVFADRARVGSRRYEKAKRRRDASEAQRLARWSRFMKYEDWHFLNVPRSTREVANPPCPQGCVLTGIEEHRARLADASSEDWRRAEAMMLLGHWVGDVHQPLHVSYSDDSGGNRIDRIRGGFYRSDDLHAVWDSGIIDAALGERDWWPYALELAAQIEPGQRSAWEQSTPSDWANESYQIVTSDAVDYCEWKSGTCATEGRIRTLRADYQKKMQPIVEIRLKQAGVRFARLIADALDDE